MLAEVGNRGNGPPYRATYNILYGECATGESFECTTHLTPTPHTTHARGRDTFTHHWLTSLFHSDLYILMGMIKVIPHQATGVRWYSTHHPQGSDKRGMCHTVDSATSTELPDIEIFGVRYQGTCRHSPHMKVCDTSHTLHGTKGCMIVNNLHGEMQICITLHVPTGLCACVPSTPHNCSGWQQCSPLCWHG